MSRKELSNRDFKPHEIQRLQTHIEDLLPVFHRYPHLRETDVFVEGGVGRGIFALLLIQNLCKQLHLPNTGYVGFEVLPFTSGGKSPVEEMSAEDIRTVLGRQSPFSPHGKIIYNEVNADHCLTSDHQGIYRDNHVLVGDCFRYSHVNRVMTALGYRNPIFIDYNATGALLGGSRNNTDSWFDQVLPYGAWMFLSHLPTPWELENPTIEEFYFREIWLKVVRACEKAKLSIFLLRNGIIAVKENST